MSRTWDACAMRLWCARRTLKKRSGPYNNTVGPVAPSIDAKFIVYMSGESYILSHMQACIYPHKCAHTLLLPCEITAHMWITHHTYILLHIYIHITISCLCMMGTYERKPSYTAPIAPMCTFSILSTYLSRHSRDGPAVCTAFRTTAWGCGNLDTRRRGEGIYDSYVQLM